MTMRRYAVYWLRASRTFVVQSVEGATVAEVDTLDEAWQVAETLERDHRRRVAARQAALSTAAKVQALRSRSAFALR